MDEFFYICQMRRFGLGVGAGPMPPKYETLTVYIKMRMLTSWSSQDGH
jgi:hypothetical protein